MYVCASVVARFEFAYVWTLCGQRDRETCMNLPPVTHALTSCSFGYITCYTRMSFRDEPTLIQSEQFA